MIKKCGLCEQEFDAKKKDIYCKKCRVKIYSKKYHEKNKQLVNEKSRKYWQENKEERTKKFKKYNQKPETKKRRIEYYQDPERKKRYCINRWKKSGLIATDFNLVYEKKLTDKVCKICGEHEDNLKSFLHLDHNHKTGEVRGFLCYRCNSALGNFKEDIDIMASAISYLKNKGDIDG